MDRITQQLQTLAQFDGISTAVVVSRDGFVIAGTSKGGLDVEAVGAFVSTGIGSAEVMGRELETGTLSQAMFEYDKGVIVMNELNADAVLAIVADPQANLGGVRYHVRKHAPALARVL